MTFFFFFILLYTKNILTGSYLIYISQISYIKNKLIIISLTVLFLSLAGLPPFLGFFSKFFIFSGIVFVNYIYVILFFIFYSLYSSIYYFKILKQLYFFKIEKKNIFFFYINIYLEFLFKTILFIIISSFYNNSFIFKLCYLFIINLTTI